MLVAALVLTALLLLIVYAVVLDRKPAGMPPGPSEVPFIGQRPVLTAREAEALRARYGDLVTQRLGSRRTVVVFDYKDVKDLFSRQDFAQRPEFFKRFNLDETETVGVLFNNGPQWVHGRRFILRQLKDLGHGSSSLQGAIDVEARALVDHLTAYRWWPTRYRRCFEVAALNVIWQLVAGRRYALDAKEVCKIFGLMEGVKRQSANTVLLGLFPVLAWVPRGLRDAVLKQDSLTRFLKHMKTLINSAVMEHQKNFNSDHPRDFIDEYLKEMAEQQGHGHPQVKIRMEGLHQLLFDLFNTGSDTVSNMLRWVVFYMARHPDMVRRCQKEIDAVVPLDTLVSLGHKTHLPFVEAFTSEVLRHSSMVVFLPQRAASRDVTIRGYTLPEGTMLTTCCYMIHRDPRYWKDPDAFNPERFIDESGQFKAQKEAFIPFGIGRRQCAGELLARAEYFLFSAAILQHFTITVPRSATLVEEANEFLGLRTPADQPFIYKPRH